MAMARRLAIARRSNFRVSFTPTCGSTFCGPYTEYTVSTGGVNEPDFPKSFPSQVIVVGNHDITFQPCGRAFTTSSIACTAANAVMGIISVSAGGATATVTVAGATGRVAVIGP